VIVETLHWALTPVPDWARRAGYLKELIAIRARHRRWRRQWEPHLQASRAAICAAMVGCTRHRHAMVYGSGPLLDIPLADLAAAFDTVTLVDAAHLWPTRLAVRRYPNVRLVERDVSGVVAGLLEGVTKGADTLPVPRPILPRDHETVDFLVSANILSQLALIPLRFLLRYFPLSSDEAAAFSRAVAQAHLAHLERFGGVRCLITDTVQEQIARDGAVQNTASQLSGIILPPHDATWWWDVAPPGEISPDFGIRSRMVAITIPSGNRALERQNGAGPCLDTVPRQA
jgi:hypothetical protein